MRAAYRYVAEDDDELSFEKGEIINVIEFEDPDEQVGNNNIIDLLSFLVHSYLPNGEFCPIIRTREA